MRTENQVELLDRVYDGIVRLEDPRLVMSIPESFLEHGGELPGQKLPARSHSHNLVGSLIGHVQAVCRPPLSHVIKHLGLAADQTPAEFFLVTKQSG